METIVRKYSVSDPNMTEHNKTMVEHFTDEQSVFVGFDADFDTPFEIDWDALISTAEQHPTDETVLDQQQQLTAAVEAAMEASRNKFSQSKYFIDKAFPKSPAIRNEFGYDDYDRQRKIQTGMIQFMNTFFATATKYSTELAAAGYNAGAVAEIDTIRISLDKANTKQEKFKGTRSVLAENRVIDMNLAWDKMLQVSKAGKTIFTGNPAKYQLFLLPASSETGTDISVKGKVTATDGTLVEGAEISISALGVSTFSDSNGNYALGQLPDGEHSLDFSAAGYEPQTITGVQTQEGNTTTVNVTLVVLP